MTATGQKERETMARNISVAARIAELVEARP